MSMSLFGPASLLDLVKGIRAANNDAPAYIAKAIQDIKEELKNRDVGVKATALQKLTYVRTRKPGPIQTRRLSFAAPP